MVHDVGALILFTGRFEAMVTFYRALGIDLAEERHEDGPVHVADELGPTHFAIDDAGAGVLQRPEMHPWGLQDPDGRPVEVFERR